VKHETGGRAVPITCRANAKPSGASRSQCFKKLTMPQVPESLIHGARIDMQAYVLIVRTSPPKHRHIPMCSAKPVMIRATVSTASMVIWILNSFVQSSELWADPIITGGFLELA
jgi:hypothetical protein